MVSNVTSKIEGNKATEAAVIPQAVTEVAKPAEVSQVSDGVVEGFLTSIYVARTLIHVSCCRSQKAKDVAVKAEEVMTQVSQV